MLRPEDATLYSAAWRPRRPRTDQTVYWCIPIASCIVVHAVGAGSTATGTYCYIPRPLFSTIYPTPVSTARRPRRPRTDLASRWRTAAPTTTTTTATPTPRFSHKTHNSDKNYKGYDRFWRHRVVWYLTILQEVINVRLSSSGLGYQAVEDCLRFGDKGKTRRWA